MKSKVRQRNVVGFILFNVIVCFAISAVLLSFSNKLDYSSIKNLDFQYNIITLAATMGGFLFTGVSILISVIDKNSIKEYWDNHYLDVLNYSAFFGIGLFIMIIIMALLSVFVLDIRNCETFIKIQTVVLIMGISNFGVSIKELIFVIKKIKKS